MTPTLVIATGNAHKVEEVCAILAEFLPAHIIAGIVPITDFDGYIEPVENGVTFADNALLKARAAAKFTGLPALADDSGLSVGVLGGSPGVFSARWCGHHGSDKENRDLLLGQIQDVPDEYRSAAFVSAIAVVDGTDETVVHGQVDGTLIREALGEGGFGYDPIFVPTGHKQTTAQMSAEEKNSLSHRAAALRKLKDYLLEHFQ